MDKHSHARGISCLGAESFGPDNRESKANIMPVLSFTFRSLFRAEINLLLSFKAANYQRPGKGGGKTCDAQLQDLSETHVQIP